MHSDWFNGIVILQGIWQHGEKVRYCYPSELEKTLSKWDIFVPLVTKGLITKGSKQAISRNIVFRMKVVPHQSIDNKKGTSASPISHCHMPLGNKWYGKNKVVSHIKFHKRIYKLRPI
jgi:hypothetical protein